MRLCLKLIVYLAAVTLLVNVMTEIFHFDQQQECACCKNNCPNENSCHKDSNDCLCSGKTQLQSALVKSGSLLEPSASMSYVQKTNLLYSFSFVKDIFRPPNV